MSSSTHGRTWQAPAAATLSIRSTANTPGGGGDNFLRENICPRAIHARTWVAPAAAALPIRSTANRAGFGPDTFLQQDVIGRPGIAPVAPPAEAVPVRTQAATAREPDRRSWQTPAVTTLVI